MAGAETAGGPRQVSRDVFFATEVYYTDLPDADALNAEIERGIRAWRAADPEGTFRTNVPQLGGWHSATDMHARPEFDRLTLEIFELVQAIFDTLGYSAEYEAACDSMWANVNPRYAHNRQHTHPHALWSGVYWVRAPESSGLLSITDPRPQAHVLEPYFDPQRRAANSFAEAYYQPQAGRLVVFPGWLAHAVQPNLSDAPGEAGERISVSFNFGQRRRGSAGAANSLVVADVLARRTSG